MWSVYRLYHLLWTIMSAGNSPVQEWWGSKGGLPATKQGLRRITLYSRQSLSACGSWLFWKLPHCIGPLTLWIEYKEQLWGFRAKEGLQRKCEENIFEHFRDALDLSYVPDLNTYPPLPFERETERCAMTLLVNHFILCWIARAVRCLWINALIFLR